MANEKLGIENLKKLFNFGIAISKTIGDDLKDKKFSFTEMLGLFPQLMQIQDFVAHKDDIVAEVKDLDFEEIKELIGDAEGIINNEQVTVFVEAAMNFALSAKDLIAASKALFGAKPTTFEPATNPDGTSK